MHGETLKFVQLHTHDPDCLFKNDTHMT